MPEDVPVPWPAPVPAPATSKMVKVAVGGEQKSVGHTIRVKVVTCDRTRGVYVQGESALAGTGAGSRSAKRVEGT